MAKSGAGSDNAFEAAHARLLDVHGIQFDLPRHQQPEPPAWLEPLLEVLRAIGPYAKYIFWICVGLGLAIILFLIVRELTGARWRLPWRRRIEEPSPQAGWQPEVAAARALLAEADALAAHGEFAEAVHLLLGRSVEDLAERRPDLLKPSSTARELAASGLPQAARTPLVRIVRAVEVSLFGGEPLGEADWRDCRQAYEAFAFPGHWR